MKKKLLGNIINFSASLLLGLSTFNAAIADDIEIFFGGQAADDLIVPNILFVIDNSGSMDHSLCTSWDCPEDQLNKTRMDVLKESFTTLMESTRGMSLNAGLLRYYNHDKPFPNLGSIYHPIENINNPVDGTFVDILSSTVTDADENLSTGEVTLDGDELRVGMEGDGSIEVVLPNGRNNWASEIASTIIPNRVFIQGSTLNFLEIGNFVALHFVLPQGIPAGAVIDSATLQLNAANPTTWTDSNDNLAITVSADHNVGILPIERNGLLSTRYNNSKVQPMTWWLAGTRVDNSNLFDSPDISGIIQQVVDHNPQMAVNSITILMKRVSGRQQITGAYPPQHKYSLSLKYSTPKASPASRLARSTVAYQSAIRFANVPVPQGAKVSKATLRLTPAMPDEAKGTFIISAEATGHASPLTGEARSLSSKPQTNAKVTTELSPWGADAHEADITNIMQEIVNRDDWCGDNAATILISPSTHNTILRQIASEESFTAQPELTIEYDASDDNVGCFTRSIVYPILNGYNDAQVINKNGSAASTNLDSATLNLGKTDVGLRFHQFPVKPQVDILEAYLEFTASGDASNNISLSISGEKTDNSYPFNEDKVSITGRPRTSTTMGWKPSEKWSNGMVYRSPDISAIIEEIINTYDYEVGNSISLFVSPSGSTNSRAVHSRDSLATHAPRLVIRVAANDYDEDATRLQVRDRLINYTNALISTGSTPTLGKLLAAQAYMTGPNSPMTNVCQTNHIVLLSDGEPQYSRDDVNKISSLTNDTCVYQSRNSMEAQTTCGRSLTKWMESTDQLSSLEGENSIITHTIGYATTSEASNFLRGIASPHDDGVTKRYYEAHNSNDLLEAFGSILQEVLSVEASFNGASIAVNQYRSYQHSNAFYYGLFTPSKNINWIGNLKKYKMGVETKTVNGKEESSYFLVDQKGKKAVDTTTGQFIAGTTSFWAPEPDGNKTAMGGAASQLPHPDERKIYTDIKLSDNDSLSKQPFTLNNSAITKSMLGDASMADQKRADIINWGRGFYSGTSNPRQQLGDPLHSQPALVGYGCLETQKDDSGKETCVTEDLALFFGTNQGFLHAVDANTGEELFAYIPEQLIENLQLFENNRTIAYNGYKTYGIDGSPVIWRIDNNNDGIIDPKEGDKVYLYVGMRRGGSSYVALDVTDRKNPKFMWKIHSNSAGNARTSSRFSKMGQSWSTPTRTNIVINGEVRRVLVFGGGYDLTNDDDTKSRTDDTFGNSVFMVDAETGELLWSAGQTSSSADLVLSKMKYSVPGDIVVLDMNFDGLGDQLIFADMGGQVWRLFIDQAASKNSRTPVVVPYGGIGSSANGVVADLNDGSHTGNRRFYMKPVTGITEAGDRSMFTIGIGSGYQAHPLNDVVQDRFYVLKSSATFTNPTNVATLTEKDLYDATSNAIQTGSSSDKQNAEKAFALINNDGSFANSGGWYIKLEESGEKVLSDISLTDGYFSFVSYEPGTAPASCFAVQGTNRYYSMKASDASAPNGQRFTIIPSTGIISSTQLVVLNKADLVGATDDADGLVALTCVGTNCTSDEHLNNAVQQTGWIDSKTN